ncbi:MAG TPA: hypothetical protein VG944_24285 [Fimbriimonas sp.]|nr:hypothetical protein [Fimbriimonas sp.]
MFTYLKCRWIHEHIEEPICLYSELSENRWEKRKVEIYRDGSMAPASEDFECGDTLLGGEAIPVLPEIASDPQFEPSDITAEEFEKVWAQATTNPRWPLTKIG